MHVREEALHMPDARGVRDRAMTRNEEPVFTRGLQQLIQRYDPCTGWSGPHHRGDSYEEQVAGIANAALWEQQHRVLTCQKPPILSQQTLLEWMDPIFQNLTPEQKRSQPKGFTGSGELSNIRVSPGKSTNSFLFSKPVLMVLAKVGSFWASMAFRLKPVHFGCLPNPTRLQAWKRNERSGTLPWPWAAPNLAPHLVFEGLSSHEDPFFLLAPPRSCRVCQSR